jgi:hypothetical protein
MKTIDPHEWVLVSDFKNEFDHFCLKKNGKNSFEIFLGGYEVLGNREDFRDIQTDQLKFPEEFIDIDFTITDDGLIVGTVIIENESRNALHFNHVTDPQLQKFLDSFDCDSNEILNWIAEVSEGKG